MEKKWIVKTDVNDTHAPDNVFGYFWLEHTDGTALIGFDQECTNQELQEIANILNSAPETLAKYEEVNHKLEAIEGAFDALTKEYEEAKTQLEEQKKISLEWAGVAGKTLAQLHKAIELLRDSQACIDFGTNAYRENEKFLTKHSTTETKS